MKTRRGKRKPSDIPFARLNETLALEAEAPVGHSNPAQSASELDLSIREWLRSQIDYAEARLAGKPTTAFLSAYRRHGIEYVTCDLANENDETHPITMVIAGQLDVCPGDQFERDTCACGNVARAACRSGGPQPTIRTSSCTPIRVAG